MVSMVGPMTHGGPLQTGKGTERGWEVTKPETWGLPNDWSAALGGMMTLVRVLPPDKYDEIMAVVKGA